MIWGLYDARSQYFLVSKTRVIDYAIEYLLYIKRNIAFTRSGVVMYTYIDERHIQGGRP
jgi:hypothetical protein